MMKNKLNAIDVGLRLSIVVTKYKGGIDEAAKSIGISKWTLERYILGAPNMPLLKTAALCKKVNVNVNWLLYGD